MKVPFLRPRYRGGRRASASWRWMVERAAMLK
jgi:hypothetical protein